MDLAFNASSPFTRWVVEANLLHEPFVVIDIGVQGGENPKWHLLGDHLVVHGLDPIEEVIETLRRDNAGKPNRHYHWLAAGSQDGSMEFYFNAADPCSSSFYPQGGDRFRKDGARVEQPRPVEVRRLDSLLNQGVIPRADFIKVDVEGFESEVFAGGGNLLSSVLGIETETNFNISPVVPKSHFVTIHDVLLRHGLLVFDLNFNRIPRATFQAALLRKGLSPIADQESVGRPATLNVLFCRDLISETDQPQNYAGLPRTQQSVDALIKVIIIYELYGLSDIALDTVARFSDRLGERLDVAKAVVLLADPDCRKSPYTNSVADLERLRGELAQSQEHVRQLLNSTSWRVTAPFRAARKYLAS